MHTHAHTLQPALLCTAPGGTAWSHTPPNPLMELYAAHSLLPTGH